MTPPETALSDEALALRVQEGSVRSFEELLARYEKRIYQFIRYKTANTEAAEDLAQTVFITAYEKIGRYRERHPFAAWLFTIARRKVIDYYRRRHAFWNR